MRVVKATLRQLSIPLRETTKTSYGALHDKDVIIVEVETAEGNRGVAECVAMAHPSYTEETVQTAWHILHDYLIPHLSGLEWIQSEDLHGFYRGMANIRGHAMAKAGLEMALWDAYAAETETPLHQLLGGQIREIPVGISLGIQADAKKACERAKIAVDDGYQRLKFKIQPGDDVAPLRAVRNSLPDVGLMADANGAYEHASLDVFQELDSLGLLMIEQPFAYNDFIRHAALQKTMRTPICLDESICSMEDLQLALKLDAGRVLNLKPGRVGGFQASREMIAVGAQRGMEIWCGGMYETGIGRLHNIALCSLDGFTLPTDNGPSDRYFIQDIISPKVEFSRPGFLLVEPMCGVASRVDWEAVHHFTITMKALEI
jgi:O-succinylbenzoate synthase